jgi:hypothetical protein
MAHLIDDAKNAGVTLRLAWFNVSSEPIYEGNELRQLGVVAQRIQAEDPAETFQRQQNSIKSEIIEIEEYLKHPQRGVSAKELKDRLNVLRSMEMI